MSTQAAPTLDILARDVERVESLREAKDVQRTFAHLAQFGLWEQMAELFADDATLRWGDHSVVGRTEIAAWLKADVSAGGVIPPGSLHTEIFEQPLANLSVDGRTVLCRWNAMRFLGDGDGEARIEGGVYENEYRLEGGRWRIARMHFHPLYDGDYSTGWTNYRSTGIPIVPPHFTVDETGVPIPAPSGTPPRSEASVQRLADRIARLGDEDAVRNLQHIYGYYVDRKMWSDVVDLFSDRAVVDVGGADPESGLDGVRRAMERMGSEGLTNGQLNDHPIFALIVDVQPGGREAIARGIEIGMLGDAGEGKGSWSFSVFRNRFVKADGQWKLKEVNVTPLVHADYHEGWGRGSTYTPVSLPVAPAFLEVGARTARYQSDGPGETSAQNDSELRDLQRQLNRSQAYDAVENVSGAYGFYIDDFQWPQMAGIFAVNGNKQNPFAGYFLGRDRIQAAVDSYYRGPSAPDTLRERISFHWRIQPVIFVSEDGRSASVRTRLFQPRTAMSVTPEFTGFAGAMYPNDQAVLEDGIWRLWSLTIDEHYFSSPTWAGGWASAQNRPADAPNPPGSRLLTEFPPDIKLTELGERMDGFRGGPGRTLVWPEILPMWFHYRNPVSGRVPERYWPDSVPSTLRPETSMTMHGYQLPSTGPSDALRDIDPL